MGRASHVASKDGESEGRIDSVSGVGVGGIGDVAGGGLEESESGVEGESLQDGSGESERREKSADCDGGGSEADGSGDADERVQSAACKGSGGRGDDDAGEGKEAKEADGGGPSVVARRREEKGQGHPKVSVSGGDAQEDETHLGDGGVLCGDSEDGDEGAGVRQVGVGGRVIGHEEPEENDGEKLSAEAEPIDGTPGERSGHDASDDATHDDTHCDARGDDGEAKSALVGGANVADQGQENLRGECSDGDEEGQSSEEGKRGGETKPRPDAVSSKKREDNGSE